MASTEDAAAMLADFVSSLDNLPSEVHHILQEIGHKEARAYDFRNRAASRDQNIQKHARPQAQGGMGLLVVNPKEEGAISKIRNDFEKAEATARDKVALSERGVSLLSRHLSRLNAQLELLTPNVPPLPTLPSFAPIVQAPPAPSATQYSTTYNTPVAPLPTQYQSSYSAGTYGMGTGSTTMGTPAGQQQYPGYGTPTGDKRKIPTPQSGSAPVPVALLPAQMHPNPGHSPHPNTAYPYPSPQPLAAGTSRAPGRPSRLSNVYPSAQGQQIQSNVNHMQQQQQAHLQQQTRRLQQQQMHHLQQQQQQQQLQQMHHQQQQQQQQQQHHPHGAHSQKRKRRDEGETEDDAGEGEDGADGEDLTPYCFCQRPSFGEMIGCDAPACAIEWFHLNCVGLKVTPEGSWYCSQCEPKVKAAESAGRGRSRK